MPSSNTDCRFCQIVQTRDCHIVLESENSIAFLDKAPVNPGHLLIIPKIHIEDIEELGTGIFVELMTQSKKLAQIIKSLTACKKVGLLVAGFDIPHAHVHIVPMLDKTEVCTNRINQDLKKNASEQELLAMANSIRYAVRHN